MKVNVMKHTYEKPVITVDAGMAEGVYAASGAPTTQIRKCSLLKQIIFLRQYPIPMLSLLLFFPFFRPLPLFFFLLFLPMGTDQLVRPFEFELAHRNVRKEQN